MLLDLISQCRELNISKNEARKSSVEILESFAKEIDLRTQSHLGRFTGTSSAFGSQRSLCMIAPDNVSRVMLR